MRICLACFALVLLVPALPAADPHPIVAGFERFYGGDKADLTRGGRLLLGELNCAACHDATGAKERKQAPILDKVGDRVRPTWIKKFLADPHAVKPGTTMPNLFASDTDKASKIEALTHFLASTGTLSHERPQLKSIGAGQKLYAQVGCVACHGSRDAKGKPAKVLSTSVPLGDLEAKYTVPGLATFLADPLHDRPSGRMPRVLTAKEARDVAGYLLQGLKVPLVRATPPWVWVRGQRRRRPARPRGSASA